MAAITDDLINAFTQTTYLVFSVEQQVRLRINEFSEPLWQLHNRHNVSGSAFITAANPCSEINTAAENTRRQDELKADLQALTITGIPATAIDPEGDWPDESGFLAIGITKPDAVALGEKYEQNAIVYSQQDAIPRLVLLR